MRNIMLCGEAWGEMEERSGEPFVGPSGDELDRMMKAAGLLSGVKKEDLRAARGAYHLTNVVNKRPPGNKIELWIRTKVLKNIPKGWVEFQGAMVQDWIPGEVTRLYKEIQERKPSVILAFGNTALWALAGEDGVMKWRGSVLPARAEVGHECWIVPAYHPAYVLRVWEVRNTVIQDMYRASQVAQGLVEPERFPTVRPTWDQTIAYVQEIEAALAQGPSELILDLEIKWKRVLCMNLTNRANQCFCLPLRYSDGWYWNEEQHVELVTRLYLILQHPNLRLTNQNLGFDIQFLWRDLRLWPKAHYDTMIAQNVLYPSGGTDSGEINLKKKKSAKGKLKSLDYLASTWCHWYRYWKDDGKFWADDTVTDEELWTYGCKDGWYTWEVAQAQRKQLAAVNMLSQVEEQMTFLNAALVLMHRGVLVDQGLKKELERDTNALIERKRAEVEWVAGRNLWAEKTFSLDKLKDFLYGDLGQTPVLDRETRQPKCDDEALLKIKKKTPWLTPIVDGILTVRSYQTVLKVVCAPTDPDGRWRTSYNVAGTLSFRFSSSENPFGTATNLQNLTLGRDIAK